MKNEYRLTFLDDGKYPRYTAAAVSWIWKLRSRDTECLTEILLDCAVTIGFLKKVAEERRGGVKFRSFSFLHQSSSRCVFR